MVIEHRIERHVAGMERQSFAQRCHFHVMRHGEKDGDRLTDLGYQQVAQAADERLRGVRLAGAFHSGMNRTIQTTATVLKTLGLKSQDENDENPNHILVREERGFGFKWILEDPNLPPFYFDTVEAQIDGNGREQPVYEWIRRSPHAWALRERFHATMASMARDAFQAAHAQAFLTRLANVRTSKDIHFFVASHSPLGELAILNPKHDTRLGFAQMLRYTFETTLAGTTLVSSERA